MQQNIAFVKHDAPSHVTLTQPRTDHATRPPVEVVRITVSEPAEVAANGLLAMVDIRVGGILLHDLKVRRGRGDTIFINPPSKKVGGRWLPYSEFISDALAAEVRRVILSAVSEVTR